LISGLCAHSVSLDTVIVDSQIHYMLYFCSERENDKLLTAGNDDNLTKQKYVSTQGEGSLLPERTTSPSAGGGVEGRSNTLNSRSLSSKSTEVKTEVTTASNSKLLHNKLHKWVNLIKLESKMSHHFMLYMSHHFMFMHSMQKFFDHTGHLVLCNQ
jgi:hypothetical protein